MRNFSSFVDGYIQYTEGSVSPYEFLVWSAFSVISGALNRRVWCDGGGYTVFPNLYVALIGPAASGKSVASRPAADLLREADLIQFMPMKITEADMINNLQYAGKKQAFVWKGKNYINSSIFSYSSEAAQLLSAQAHGNIIYSLTDLYDTKMWNSEIPSFDKSTQTDGMKLIYNHCITLLMCSTSNWLTSLIGKENLKDGFPSRIILVVNQDKPAKHEEWIMQDTKEDLRKKLLADLKRIGKLNGPYQLTDDYKELGLDLRNHVTSWVYANQDDPLQNIYARKFSQAQKLSMVIKASHSDEMVLTAADLQSAWDCLSMLESTHGKAFETANATGPAHNMKMVWSTIRKSDRQAYGYLEFNAMFENLDTREVNEAVNKLIGKGKMGRVDGGFRILDRSPL